MKNLPEKRKKKCLKKPFVISVRMSVILVARSVVGVPEDSLDTI